MRTWRGVTSRCEDPVRLVALQREVAAQSGQGDQQRTRAVLLRERGVGSGAFGPPLPGESEPAAGSGAQENDEQEHERCHDPPSGYVTS